MTSHVHTASIPVDGRVLRFTHLDRILYPATGFTKGDLLAYYLALADVLLPHLRDRPLTLGRFPSGVDGRGFAQTEVRGLPDWMRTVPLTLASGVVKRFTLIDDRPSLAWLAQMGVIELHVFLGALPDLERPTAIVFDLDPPEPDGLLDAAIVACRLRARLAELGSTAFVKTTGSTGLHVLVPADALTYAETRAFAARIAADLGRELPDLVTDRLPIAERAGRVLIDVRQNSRRLTIVAPYSLRAVTRPTAAVPLLWSEVEAAVARRTPETLVFSPTAAIERTRRMPDPFAALARVG